MCTENGPTARFAPPWKAPQPGWVVSTRPFFPFFFCSGSRVLLRCVRETTRQSLEKGVSPSSPGHRVINILVLASPRFVCRVSTAPSRSGSRKIELVICLLHFLDATDREPATIFVRSSEEPRGRPAARRFGSRDRAKLDLRHWTRACTRAT